MGLAQLPGSAAATTFNGCKWIVGSVNYPFTLVGSSATGSPWRLRAQQTSSPVSAQGTATSGQHTPITISYLRLKWTNPSCDFELTGSLANATYTNGSFSTLAVPAVTTAADSDLTVSNLNFRNGATSCLGGAISGNGNKFSFSTTYTVAATTSANNPIWINAT